MVECSPTILLTKSHLTMQYPTNQCFWDCNFNLDKYVSFYTVVHGIMETYQFYNHERLPDNVTFGTFCDLDFIKITQSNPNILRKSPVPANKPLNISKEKHVCHKILTVDNLIPNLHNHQILFSLLVLHIL